MTRTLSDARRWMREGTDLVSGALATLDEDAFLQPSALPGWTRKHVVAHLGANADGLSNLVRWAATGERTPMYASMEQRNADIEAGATRSGAELIDYFVRASGRLDAGMNDLTEVQWSTEVLTAQGNPVPASETPWMRSREVMIHAIDLNTAIGFNDLPTDFLTALCSDIAAKRTAANEPSISVVSSDTGVRWTVGNTGDAIEVTGTVAAIAHYLTGRGSDGVVTLQGEPAPPLPVWL